MKSSQAIDKLRAQLREEASEWFVAFSEGEVDAADAETFDRWLRTSPEHIRAYLRISALWENSALLAQHRDVESLVQKALAESNVVGLNARAKETRAASASWRNAAIVACLALVGAVVAAGLWLHQPRARTYMTGAAEQRTLQLMDGSAVQLNARSQIQVRFTENERRIDLVAGQALFSVTRDSERPFIVRSDHLQAKVVGTRFDVYRKRSGTAVTVVEGQVAVLPARSASAHSTLISTGEQAVVTAGAELRVRQTDVTSATAWVQGKLIFDSAPLREIVEEFNRINTRQLVIEDEALLSLHISGAFPASDPSRIARFLQQRFGVVIEETGDELRIRRAQ